MKTRTQLWSKGGAAAENVAFASPIATDRVAALSAFYAAMGVSSEEVRQTNGNLAMVCSNVLWVVTVRREPISVGSKQRHPFNLRAGEVPLVVLGNVVYSKETVTTTYQGRSQGVSARVAKGLFYHANEFKGRRIESTSLKQVDVGTMLLTTQNIYFGGAHANFRIPYDKVVSFQPYADGIGLFRDAANAKPEVFTFLEAGPDGKATTARPVWGWFVFNLAHSLAQTDVRGLAKL